MEVLVREIERDEEEQGETEEEKEEKGGGGGEGEGGNKTEKRKVAGMAVGTVVSLLLTRMDVRKNQQKCWKGGIRIKEREEKRS
ncbi:hypothetical protein HZH66_011475 [Vespula vulgaris]|uniref:Uncharacterized protein n=1 Tax=Vespula vulgaris TaxID=7454 RepID=A0A834JEY6_VESVU|nr:hypothetical protein HZH66_011475 [Vespula vulgaris]